MRTVGLVAGIVVLLVFAALIVMSQSRHPSFNDVWVINLDKERKRWENIQAKYEAPFPIQRWKATYGKTTTRTEAMAEGVHVILSQPVEVEDRARSDLVVTNPGIIGCWMSHKRVLRHVGALDANEHDGHLICEDDIDFHKGWDEEWRRIAPTIPSDWDIVYLAMNHVKGNTQIAPRLFKVNPLPESDGNFGNQCYVVRHGSIPKLLEILRFMTSPVDVQLPQQFDRLNAYLIEPSLLKLNPTLSKDSSIDVRS